MIGNEMFDAAQQALHEMAMMADSVDIGLPPGAEPLPWKDQAVQFIDDLPDLLAHGPRYQTIEQTYGPGKADEYLATMGQQIWTRQRRKPV